jgi:hypothetical protein
MSPTKKQNLEFNLAFCETNLRVVLRIKELNKKAIAFNKKEIKRIKKELEKLKP